MTTTREQREGIVLVDAFHTLMAKVDIYSEEALTFARDLLLEGFTETSNRTVVEPRDVARYAWILDQLNQAIEEAKS